jgi:hypothetical protein
MLGYRNIAPANTPGQRLMSRPTVDLVATTYGCHPLRQVTQDEYLTHSPLLDWGERGIAIG